jgi:electron transfer flavoprotein beta subunit
VKIVACIKQVPETTEVKINPETNTLIREGVPSVINPFDVYAMEESVRLKEAHGGESVVITMGPPQADAALRDAISVGLDVAVLITDRAFAGGDTWATSYVLSEAIKKVGDVDLVVCGKQTTEGDTAQVGPGIAAHTGIPCVTYVRKIVEVKEEDGKTCITVERLLEEGVETVKVQLPAVITVVKEINEPRIASLKGRMKAKKAQIVKWTNEDLALDETKIGLDGSPTRVVKIFSPAPKEGGMVFDGEPDETVAQLVEEIKDLI